MSVNGAGGGGGGGGGIDGASWKSSSFSSSSSTACAGGVATTAAGGGGGGAAAIGLACTGVAGLDSGFSSIALSGRGGPIVPKRMLARCLALPPAGRSSSSSDEFSDSATDHSSSSGRARDLRSRGPGSGEAAKADFWLSCCCTRRWNGFVDWTSALGGAGAGAVSTVARGSGICSGGVWKLGGCVSVGWLNLRKYGFLDSVSAAARCLTDSGLAAADTSGSGSGSNGAAGGVAGRWAGVEAEGKATLCVGVLVWGVMSTGPSSSDDSSSSRPSS